jgi:hypothetical protein
LYFGVRGKIVEGFQRSFSWSREPLTIKYRADWLACVDRSLRLAAHPPLPHIFNIMQRVLEQAREQHPAFDAGAFFGQATARRLAEAEE